jgi:hypothetical protein
MTALVLNELESSQFDSVLDRYREEFHNKLQENNPDLLNFEKYAVDALKAIGVVGLDAPLRSEDEFTVTELDGSLLERLKALPKPDAVWNQELQQYIHDRLWDNIVAKADVTLGVKSFLEWHEEEYMFILQDDDIGGKNGLFDYVFAKDLYFNEDGEEVPAPTLEA